MNSTNSTQNQWQIKLLYDGDCPLCVREVNFLRKKDAGRGKVAFVDIADDDYSPEDNANIDYEMAMSRIHAILPDGSIITNIEVFRKVYEILGMGWVYSFTKIPFLGRVANKIYGIWADWRLKMTGRPDLITLMAERNKRLASSGKLTCQ
jgi:predicted DCC family thiol-disulfide oxidoreductase YuxK